ncbi:MAG: hypothetical protein JNK38_15645 [Acidobacteria bacterium]|nr:hypothetical protein [Acidobacteriota bacterium]
MTLTIHQPCAHCEAEIARQYQLIKFDAADQSHNSEEMFLCARCARVERKRLQSQPETGEGLTRQELISLLDRFFAASGVFDVCGRCHQQGTGCCPPTCRVMGAAGCDPNNKFGKTVFCATFVCSALLNAIAECDAETGRTLKWIKRELGAAEFPIYEMITRVPAEAREPVRPLALPRRYPKPPDLNGEAIKEKLLALADEVLALRRLWHEQEQEERAAVKLKASQSE